MTLDEFIALLDKRGDPSIRLLQVARPKQKEKRKKKTRRHV